MELDELLAWSQIFTIASAPTPESERIIDRRRLALLPVGSALIVLSRSWPLDMQAVRDRIANAEICGAFDVYDVEPLPPNDVLRRSPNVTLTPHIAGRCADSNRLMAEMAVAELKKRLL
jgi:phosphoglycerate dehydrogenase-like enzyme